MNKYEISKKAKIEWSKWFHDLSLEEVLDYINNRTIHGVTLVSCHLDEAMGSDTYKCFLLSDINSKKGYFNPVNDVLLIGIDTSYQPFNIIVDSPDRDLMKAMRTMSEGNMWELSRKLQFLAGSKEEK